jgi:hypothetical protein
MAADRASGQVRPTISLAEKFRRRVTCLRNMPHPARNMSLHYLLEIKIDHDIYN